MNTHLEPIVLDPHGADIHGENARLRARGPATLVELPGGVRAWAITDQAVLKMMLAGDDVSKDPRLHWPAFQAGEIAEDWPLRPWVAAENMFTAYGDRHRRLRRIVAPAFAHRRVQALRPRIGAIAAELLEALAVGAAGGVVDLRALFAYPLPIRVISELMGVPATLALRMRTCVDRFFDTSLFPEESQAAYATMYGLLGELIDYRIENPGNDLTSLLVGDSDGPDGVLGRQEVLDTLLLVISAGHETTVNLIDHAICELLMRPELRAGVEGGRIEWSAVIEETLRYQSSVAHLPLRYAVRDISVCGVDIKRGDAVLASYAAASRDPSIHGATTDEFDPARPTVRQHVAFGWGAHRCLGESLARLEAGIALPAVFARFPDMKLDVADPAELGAVTGFISNGHRHLPVRLMG
ncbi:cytochrome P450 family protein [Nocardia carnea]|uniref:cytochrome P450 family protein n=1 Tax=Nocardia carnea TaxID=37328 RepID=UPI002454DFCC|nr:cytochrome P450 [Nocardia carnea]